MKSTFLDSLRPILRIIHGQGGCFVLAMLVCFAANGLADDASSQSAEQVAIERALPFIQAEGEKWIKERNCVSCHQVPFMVWSLNAAAKRGFEMDEQKLRDWNAWAMDAANFSSPASRGKAPREKLLSENADASYQLLLSNEAAPRPHPDPEWPGFFQQHLVLSQQPDGYWQPGGQLPGQKRPARETQEVSTMWAAYVLERQAGDNEDARAAIDKAWTWLGAETRPESTEWLAARLLLTRHRGDQTAADAVRGELLKHQHADGGWGWRCEDPSDALGTGMALYALSLDSLTAADPAIAAALKFLCDTQQPDGSWPVHGTKANKKDHVQPTATYWGTCWAVIGMAATLDSP